MGETSKAGEIAYIECGSVWIVTGTLFLDTWDIQCSLDFCWAEQSRRAHTLLQGRFFVSTRMEPMKCLRLS